MPTDALSLSYVEQYEGKVVPFSFNAGYVGLSYVVSLVGAASTLELIRRRTSHKGIYNLLLLAGAATCMGGIAIWSMHYVGNRAITMLDGAEALQIAYATKFTILSFFMPILVLLVAFVVATAGARAVWWRVYVSGFLSGSAICGMHYIGDLSISNYRTAYHVPYVVGAALIAVSASSAALALFFIFEAAWTNAWWKRAGCAMVLAGAVSGMHWCAAVGTQYVLIASPSSSALHGGAGGGAMSRTDTTIIVSCLSIAACAIVTASIAFSTYMRSVSAVKAQKVVLASAVFDHRGRIMVSYEGLLPSQVVTTEFIPKTSSEFFDTAHPIFHWMFRASRSWASVASLIDPMQRHVGQLSQSKLGLIGDDGVLVSNYNAIICEMFCLAAAGLASLMKDSILDAGKLWDEILTTGGDTSASAVMANHRPKTPASAAASPSLGDADRDSASEKGLQTISTDHGRGSLMFLVRHARTNDEVERLKAEGYRFAEIHQVIGNIRSNMQILTPDLLGRLTRMAELGPSVDCGYAPGVYVGAFVLRARLDHNNSGGFDVLVQKDARHRLPTRPLAVQHLQEFHRNYLKQLHGLTTAAIIQRLGGIVTGNERKSESDEASFSQQILHALIELRDGFDQTTSSNGSKSSPFDNAVLIAQVTQLPCRAEPASKEDKNRDWDARKGQQGAPTSSLICLRLVLPIHARHIFKEYQFDPLPLFRTRQLVYPGSPQQVAFSHQIHQEVMASVLQDVPLSPGSSPKPRIYLGKITSLMGLKKKNPADRSAIAMQQLERSSREGLTHTAMSHISHDEQSSELGDRKQSAASLYGVASNDHGNMDARQLGGIMFSQQVVVGIEERGAARKDAADGAGISIAPKGQINLSSQVDTSYTAVATASDGQNDGAGANGRQPETVFVDELFRLCVNGYIAR